MARNRRTKEYDHESLRDEREYGFYWYSGIWHILRPVLIGLAALVLVFGLLSTGYGVIDQQFLSAVDPQDTTEVPFSIASGSSLTKVAGSLEQQGLIKNRSVFKYYCDFAGLGQKIQAGDYQLSKSMDMFAIADKLTTGDGRPITAKITLIPGWTVEDLAAQLKQQGVIADESAFLAQCRTGEGLTDYYFIQEELKTDRIQERKYLLEGYLSPNTYEVYTTASATDILKKFLDQTDKVFSFEWQEQAAQEKLTIDQVLTLASLIEKEAKSPDFAKVSAVFHNRLDSKMTLGSDVTIHYITGERRMSLRRSDLSVESPYNTYLHAGLPLGPICNPSAEAIKAALYPDEVFVAERYLYFCSKDPDTGELHFSKTQEEHDRAVQIYAPLWQAYDQERGM
ncbi:MAG: endolytic transglycosylase MltG [Candidatus Limiplasma sp.]|nr:endolytic transglycosylase MltG [Candidatus Limiplasma sp.]